MGATLDDLLSTLHDLVTAVGRLPQRRRPRVNMTAYGVLKLAPASGQIVTCVSTPDSGEEQDHVVTYQANSLPPGFGGIAPSTTCGVLQITIRYYQGEVQYQLGPFDVTDLEQHTVDVCARQIDVYYSWANYTGAGSGTSAGPSTPAPLEVWASAGLTKSSHAATLPNTPVWFRSPATLYTNLGGGAAVVAAANTQIAVPSSGQFFGMRGSLVTGTGTLYVQVFDSPPGAAAPTTGAEPLWTSDALVAGQSYSSRDPSGQTAWIYGLWAGLSSTPQVFTPAAGTFSCDVAGG